MQRRTFNKLIGLGTVGGFRGWAEAHPQPQSPQTGPPPLKWPEGVYRRLLVDTHIPDWDPQLMARFDPADYVRTIAQAGFQSLMQYANSHVGLCLWQTKVGQPHANMKGRDYFGEVLEECRKHGLHATTYYTLIYDNWAYEKHPDWRIVSLGDDEQLRPLRKRYGTVCPNSPYRAHAKACLEELVGNYEFESIFLDMTFWSDVCYCSHCTERFWREYGAEPPHIVDWDDPVWRNFQKARQAWMLDFGKAMTQTIKAVRPITVNHQFSLVFSPWTVGQPLEIAQACDFVGGDFYGGPAQHSLVCKTYYGLTRSLPFEFHTSRTRNLNDHVTIKPIEEIRIESFVATLHSAALMLIDGINPDGSLNKSVYEFLGKLNAQRAVFEPYLGGELQADVAIYYDKESMYNPEVNRVPVGRLSYEVSDNLPHRDAVIGSARLLREGHIPFGVVTNANLDQLKKYRAVIVPSVFEMTAGQAAMFRKFVEDGGVLIASGVSSLDRSSSAGPKYLLEDVLGVRYKGKLGTVYTYLTPKDPELAKIIWPQDHLTFKGPMVHGEALPSAKILATVTLPFVEPEVGSAVGSHFASIHSNPPALLPGTNPAIVVNSYGKGRAVWVAAPIEIGPETVNARLVRSLIKSALPGPYKFEADTHPAVEMTLFHQGSKRRMLAGLLNIQQQLPAIPVGATVRVQVPSGKQATRVFVLPESKAIPFEKKGPYVQFRLEPFEALAMALVEYA